MNQATDFFAEFQPVSKRQWLEQIVKELKGKPLEDLYWQLNESITVDPFGHADDLPAPATPLQFSARGWEINEDIDETIPETANRQALEALAFGAESLYFNLSGTDISASVNALLKRIHPDFISIHFGGKGVESGPAGVLHAFSQLAEEQGVLLKNLRGSVYYDPAAAAGRIQDWRYLIDLLEYTHAELPGMRSISVDCRNEFRGAKTADEELAAALRRGRQYLQTLTERGMDAGRIANQMQFLFHAGTSYFVEIAKLRAFQLLWLNTLKAFGATPANPLLDVRFAPQAYTDDLYANMIRATTMAMSAVMGGANRLTVLPYDAGREDQAQYPRNFSRRIARNVQQLLKLESGLDRIADPAAGSYYIEKLTAQLAESAWQKAV